MSLFPAWNDFSKTFRNATLQSFVYIRLFHQTKEENNQAEQEED